MKTLVSIGVLLLAFALCACGQSIYVGGGPSLQSDAAQRVGLNLTVGACDSEGVNCGLVNYAGRFSFPLRQQIAYSTTAAFRRVLATADLPTGRMDLFALAGAGAAVAAGAAAFDGAMGGGLTYHPARAPHWGVTFALQADRSALNPGWQPNAFFQVGYRFTRVK